MISFFRKGLQVSMLLLTISASGQHLDTVYREFINNSEVFTNYSKFINKLSDTSFLLITNNGKHSIIDFKGQILKDASLPVYPGYATFATGYFESFDTDSFPAYYIQAVWDDCDTWGYGEVFKFNRSGDFLEQVKAYYPDPWDYLKLPKNGVFPQKQGLPKYFFIKPGTAILYFNPDSLVPFNEFTDYRAHAINHEGDIFLAGEDSIYFYKYGISGPELEHKKPHDQFLNSSSRAELINDSTFLLVSSDAISLWDQKLNLIYSSFVFESKPISLYKWQPPFLWMYSKDELLPVNFIVFDSNMNVYFEDRIILPQKSFEDLYLLPDSILISVGAEGYGPSYPASIYSYVKSHTFKSSGSNYDQDIGLTGITYDHMTFKGLNSCFGDTQKIYALENVRLKVINQGQAMVNNMILVPDIQFCSMYCFYQPLYRKEFTELSLGPGEEYDLYVDTVLIEINQDDLLTEFCLSTILPDHVDVNHSNNRFCVKLVVSSESADKTPINSIYPNPAEDVIYIEGPKLDRSSLLIFDLNGRLVLSADKVSTMDAIDIDELVEGIYYIQIISPEGTMNMGKVVKFN